MILGKETDDKLKLPWEISLEISRYLVCNESTHEVVMIRNQF